MKSLTLTLSGLVFCWYFVDISSASSFKSVVAPIGVFVFLVSFFLWLVGYFQRKGIGQSGRSRGGLGDWFDGFGDGGGGGGD